MDDQTSERDQMLCGCATITVGQFYDLIAANPKDFDEVLRETGAGQTCTACLLDLEFHYVRAFEERLHAGTSEVAIKKDKDKAISLKRRFYHFVDSLMPLVPMKLRQVSPVIYGGGISEWLTVCNDSMMYEGKVSAPPFRLDIVLRDGEGRQVHQETQVVKPGEQLRVDISEPLKRADKSVDRGPKLGWMDLMRRGEAPGVRGTTRPQFEIVSSAGICAVHTQAATERTEAGLTVRMRPGEDRHFLAVVNAEKKPLAFRLSVVVQGGADPIRLRVDIPPWGARLVEVPMPQEIPKDRLGALTDVTWTTDRINKVYVLCASPNLDRFSVDHA